ncbi:MAG: AgmX/PglI C-terminal domain-containing protein [Polyangiaceae bacterium]|nr:AgmX/PglI C-terminal domain-containing protein [Polyangiaceae bacterium]
MSASIPPPSEEIPGKSGGSAPYIIGMVVLGGLMAGLIYWKTRPAPRPEAPPPPVVTQAKPVEPPPMHAPPPPPPIEEVEDAGADAAAKATAASPGAGAPRGPCGGKCGDGESSAALASAVSSTARSAQGCYNRALRTGEASGRMTVSVQVGSTGAVCSASIIEDSVHSGEISSCVLGRFRGKSFPPPKSGCVVVNVPINFTIKQ